MRLDLAFAACNPSGTHGQPCPVAGVVWSTCLAVGTNMFMEPLMGHHRVIGLDLACWLSL